MPQYSPILYDYLKRFQDDPSSRVFAPLAESYRKAGLVDEAIDIARQGLRVHPGFVGGRVALARALFDKKEYDEVIDSLQAVVRDVPDNLVAQRILAEACLLKGRVSEALDAYKMLLYFVPQDTELVRIVQELETQAYELGSLVLQLDTTQPGAGVEVHEPAARSVMEPIVEGSRVKKGDWVRRIELLQNLLTRVERYRKAVATGVDNAARPFVDAP